MGLINFILSFVSKAYKRTLLISISFIKNIQNLIICKENTSYF